MLPDFEAPEVFRGADKFVHTKKEAQFAQFLSATVSPRQAAKFGHGVHLLVLRGIPAYLMKDISMYSIYPSHKEVLVWPFCVFKLTAGEEEAVKILEFYREEACSQESQRGTITRKWTVTLPESCTLLANAPSIRIASAKIESAERPVISGEEGAFLLGAPSAKRSKPTFRQPTPGTRHAAAPARSPVIRDVRGTSTGAVTSTTVATRENRRNVIGKIKQDFAVTVPCDSYSEPCFKVFPTGMPRWNAGADIMGARNNVGQIQAHAQSKRLAPSNQSTWGHVMTIPPHYNEPSARVPGGTPTWNACILPVGARNNVSQTRVPLQPNRMMASHQAVSCDNRSGSCALWKRVLAAVFVGLFWFFISLILLLGLDFLLKYVLMRNHYMPHYAQIRRLRRRRDRAMVLKMTHGAKNKNTRKRPDFSGRFL